MKILPILIFIISFAFSANAQNCKFNKKGVVNPPFVWMLNKLEPQTVQKIKGKVLDKTGEPIAGAIVSVLLLTTTNSNKFIGSFETDENGNFCFSGLSKGKYEVRIGHKYFQRYDLNVNLDPKNKKAAKFLNFELDVGY